MNPNTLLEVMPTPPRRVGELPADCSLHPARDRLFAQAEPGAMVFEFLADGPRRFRLQPRAAGRFLGRGDQLALLSDGRLRFLARDLPELVVGAGEPSSAATDAEVAVLFSPDDWDYRLHFLKHGQFTQRPRRLSALASRQRPEAILVVPSESGGGLHVVGAGMNGLSVLEASAGARQSLAPYRETTKLGSPVACHRDAAGALTVLTLTEVHHFTPVTDLHTLQCVVTTRLGHAWAQPLGEGWLLQHGRRDGRVDPRFSLVQSGVRVRTGTGYAASASPDSRVLYVLDPDTAELRAIPTRSIGAEEPVELWTETIPMDLDPASIRAMTVWNGLLFLGCPEGLVFVGGDPSN